MSNSLMAELAAARRARQPVAAPASPDRRATTGGSSSCSSSSSSSTSSTSSTSLATTTGVTGVTGGSYRLDGAAVEEEAPRPAKKARIGGDRLLALGGRLLVSGGASASAAPAASSSTDETLATGSTDEILEGIYLSGVEDQPAAAKGAGVTEVDCRHGDAEFVAQTGGSGRVFTLQSGEGRLKDKKGEDFSRNVRHLTSSAGKIRDARGASNEGRVWVHCAQGINRGPAGLMAFLLLHTDIPSLKAVHKLIKKRRKARTKSNTFAKELEEICRTAGKPLS